MKIELRYFTGTGNSLKIVNTCAKVFSEAGNSTFVSEISKEETALPDSDLIGFCFPVYAFGIPRICVKYLNGLKRLSKRRKAYVIINAGDQDEAGYVSVS